MKGLPWLLCLVALGAGAGYGYWEREKAREQEEQDARARAARVPAPAPAAKAAKVEAPPPPKPEAERKVEAPPPPPGPTPAEIDQAVRDLEAMILHEDFERASRAARDLVAKHSGDPGALNPAAVKLLDRIRRTESKAKAYSALAAVLETKALPATLQSLQLENGNTLAARSVEETDGGYRVEYVLGGKGVLRRDQVLSVKPLARGDYLAGRWKEIQSSLRDKKDPVDLFFFGVRKCFRDGMRREGIALLDRMLPLADSGQILALYAKDPEAVRRWEEAAGRAPLPPLPGLERPPGRRPEPLEVAEAPEKSTAAPPSPGDSGENGDGIDPEAIERARTILDRAEGALKSGNSFDARALVLSATKLLYAMPGGDPKVQELNRRAGEILERVLGRNE